MRYNKYKKNFHKRDKYPRDEGMTVTVRQIKDKDCLLYTSDAADD